ncbi:MAG: DUF488 family protein [Egibacteraceae bacterium]
MTGAVTLLTVGHGTLEQDALATLLTDAAVRLVVDVRRYPGSRRHPHVAREAMVAWLGDAGIGSRWAPDLGGRRRPSPTRRTSGCATPGSGPTPTTCAPGADRQRVMGDGVAGVA